MAEMYNRYQGNTGRVVRMGGKTERRMDGAAQPKTGAAVASPMPAASRKQPPLVTGARQRGIMEQLGKLLPKGIGELETDDIILLLVLYLMYRESGDSELLIIMGAMFLL